MRQKRSKLLTLMFSLLPGAGHMFMGFMKTGISLMSAFSFIIFLSSWLNISPLLFALPLLWFYSFFDCMNKRYASDEEFALFDDNYLFSIGKLIETSNLVFQKRRLYAGLLILLLGVFIICNNAMNLLWGFIPNEVFTAIRKLVRLFPQMVLGIVIVVIGIRLIAVKKKECDPDA